jgi:hypothetical protein
MWCGPATTRTTRYNIKYCNKATIASSTDVHIVDHLLRKGNAHAFKSG